MELVQHFLEGSAQRTPHKIALVCGKERVSFSQIDTAADQLANGLMNEGVKPGDRVAVYLENSVEAVIAIFGILKCGAVFSLINPSTKAEKLTYILRDERPAVLITVNDTQRQRIISEILTRTAMPTVVWVGGIPSVRPSVTVGFRDWAQLLWTDRAERPRLDTTDLDLGTIIYTSGTTGTPKGVMSAHRDMVFAANSITSYLENTADDVIFCSLSLAFTYGLYQLFTAMLVGATLVLEKNFFYPNKALEMMARERVTGLPAVPTMFALLLGLKSLTSYDLRSLRYITNAAAPLPVHQVLAIRALFPHAQFFSMYGQTECKRACYLPPDQLEHRPGSVGIPIPGTEVYIVDEKGNGVRPGTVGELVVKGPHLMRGYWEKPDETSKCLRPGLNQEEMVLYTGDLFRLDSEGYLYFVSRQDDIIKSRDEKVSPNEIENALHELDGVQDVAVIGVPDDILGEAIKVFVVPQEGASLTERDIRAHCAHRLEAVMVPKYVEFRSDLPKSSNGKTVRKDLKLCVA